MLKNILVYLNDKYFFILLYRKKYINIYVNKLHFDGIE
jgi:hypothetical protein